VLSKELQEEIAKIVIKDYEGVKTKSDLEKTVATQQLLYGRHVDLVLQELGQKVEGKNILDVGCGFGGTVLELNELHTKAYGLDVDKEKVKIANKIAKQKNVENTFVVSGGESIPFRNNVFDFVISVYALEHVQDPSKVVSEMIRVLRPHGILYIYTANYLYPREEHYRVFIPPMMPKFLAKTYLRLRGRNPKLIEGINYMTLGMIRKLLKNRVASYKNAVEDRIIDHIKNPNGISLEHRVARKILMTLRVMKLSFILCKFVRVIPFYFTIRVIAEKEGDTDIAAKNDEDIEKT
jgi:ubiquinone/menaquinone biosynthesis C-methylase UbiE